jgi:hypothetical protein
LEWYERYGKRIEDVRLPRDQADREAYAQIRSCAANFPATPRFTNI